MDRRQTRAHETRRPAAGGEGGWQRDPSWEHEQAQEGGPPPPRSRGPDLAALFVLLDAVRRVVPGELREQFTALVREFLLTLRSLIDWYLDRLDRSAREPEVEDIPID
jgi:hypothetical protein